VARSSRTGGGNRASRRRLADGTVASTALQWPTMTTPTAKQEALKVIERLPEDAPLDEILRELAFARMVERGLEDSEHGRTISHQEMAQRLDSWAK
jgi:hypothetical protein